MNERTWPIARCRQCAWDTRGRSFGAEPCAGLALEGCLAAELAARPKEELEGFVRMLAGAQGSRG